MLTYLRSADYQLTFCLSNKKYRDFNFLKKASKAIELRTLRFFLLFLNLFRLKIIDQRICIHFEYFLF